MSASAGAYRCAPSMYSTSIGRTIDVSASSENIRRCCTRSRTPARSRLSRNTSWSSAASAAYPSNSWGPRSLPAWGSIAITSTSGAAADASTIVERPRKLPISTIDPPAGQRVAESYSVDAWPGLIQPSTSATSVITVGRSGRSPAGSAVAADRSLGIDGSSIDDEPAQPGELQHTVRGEDLLGRRATPGFEYQQIAEQGDHHRHDRQLVERQVGRRQRRGLERPDAVAEQGPAEAHGEQDAQVPDVVHVERGAGTRTLADLEQLRVALADDDEQRAERDAEDEPTRHRHVDGHRTGGRAEHETGGDGDDVDHGHVLQPHGVEQRDHDVERDHGRGLPPSRERAQGETDEWQRDAGHAGRRDAQFTGGDRPETLGGVDPVGLDVEQVVPEVDAAGGEAEGHECDDREDEFVALVEDAGGARRGEHEHVLQPLLGPGF